MSDEGFEGFTKRQIEQAIESRRKHCACSECRDEREDREYEEALKRHDEQRASRIIPSREEQIAELEEAIRELAETVVVFYTCSDFVIRSNSLTNARKNPIACQAIDVARGAVK